MNKDEEHEDKKNSNRKMKRDTYLLKNLSSEYQMMVFELFSFAVFVVVLAKAFTD